MQKTISDKQYRFQIDLGSGWAIYDLTDDEIHICIADGLHLCNDNYTWFTTNKININDIKEKSMGVINTFEEFIKLFEPYEINKTIFVVDTSIENKLLINHKDKLNLYMEFDIYKETDIIQIS